MSTTGRRQRRSIRLPGFDYAQPGAYFVTICSYRRQLLFGDVVDGEVILSTVGGIVRDEWLRTEIIRKEITLDEFVIMPNHFHGIVIIETSSSESANVGAHGHAPLQPSDHAPLRRSPRSLGSLVARFKGSVTRQVRTKRTDPIFKVWQRNYFEHVIRDEREMTAIRRYISENPIRW
ncbi:MAG: transposase [Anaerolineales bacterium]